MNSYFVDTHAHVFSSDYEDIDSVINEAIDKNIKYIINNGSNDYYNREVLKLIDEYPNMYGAIGIHPEDVDTVNNDDIEFIRNNVSNERIVAIGEIGLDYYYRKDNKEEQKKLFERQLEIAQELDIPVIVHSREATEDTINILKKYNVRGTIHSFTGSLEVAKIYIKMGFLLGVNGVITFKNANVKNIIKELGLDNIILETDSPYLTPVPFRGTKNNPSHVLEIANFVADLYDVSLDELASYTNENIKRMYKKMKLVD